MSKSQRNDEGRERWGEFDVAIAGTSHIGRIRKTNQDAFDRFDDPERGEILLVVADGMGGHRGGEIASQMAVGTLGQLGRDRDGDPTSRLARAIERANAEIHKRAGRDYTLKSMGTTLVALLLRQDGPSFVAHVGDSRLYRLRGDRFEQLTEDHSVVTLLIQNGTITREEARDHPKRNQIMRAIGVRDEIEVEIAPIEIRADDTYLLCSDGLYGMLPEADLQILAERAPDPHAAVAWMIDAANQAGGMDNISALFVRVHEPSDDDGPPPESDREG